jgi:hypothetical protein
LLHQADQLAGDVMDVGVAFGMQAQIGCFNGHGELQEHEYKKINTKDSIPLKYAGQAEHKGNDKNLFQAGGSGSQKDDVLHQADQNNDSAYRQ